eukprot:4601338-Amphidinium_carterae.1
MLHFSTEVLTSLPGIWYSMAKAVPTFLQVSVLWRWLMSNAVALFSGPTIQQAHNEHAKRHLLTYPAAYSILIKLQVARSNTNAYRFSLDG